MRTRIMMPSPVEDPSVASLDQRCHLSAVNTCKCRLRCASGCILTYASSNACFRTARLPALAGSCSLDPVGLWLTRQRSKYKTKLAEVWRRALVTKLACEDVITVGFHILAGARTRGLFYNVREVSSIESFVWHSY